MRDITEILLQIGNKIAEIEKEKIKINSSYQGKDEELQNLKNDKHKLETRIKDNDSGIYNLSISIDEKNRKINKVSGYKKYIVDSIKENLKDVLRDSMYFLVNVLIVLAVAGLELLPILLIFLSVIISIYIVGQSIIFFLETNKERKEVKNILKQENPVDMWVKIETLKRALEIAERSKEQLRQDLISVSYKVEMLEQLLLERDSKLANLNAIKEESCMAIANIFAENAKSNELVIEENIAENETQKKLVPTSLK